jgi:N-methylhydantoinase B
VSGRPYSLDPVTFEVLKNALVTIVDEMSDQIRRTCHSFVIYNRDFSSALCDRDGDTVAQGTYDLASHVGTLHLTAKAIIAAFEGDIHPGDVFLTNDPYLGGTHFSDVRVFRPIFVDGDLIAFAQANGHWSDVGGSVPGSFDFTAREHFGEGLRIPPVRIWDRGRFRGDVARMIVSNMRAPGEAEGDLHAQTEATRVAERELLRLVAKYGKETLLRAFSEVQDYVERLTRRRLAELPDGTWETEDYLDRDPAAEGEALVPVRVRMTISGESIAFDLSGSHAAVGSFANAAFGTAFSALVNGMLVFFPDVPLNSGFYRPISVELPPASVVNAQWPTAVTGFGMTFEKIMNCVIELWSVLVPERAMACSYNMEYLEVGGWDVRRRERRMFMWYDWMVGGWGARADRDGAGALTSTFGIGLMLQSNEGQERLSPVVTTEHELLPDSAGPGRFRGGMGLVKGGTLTRAEGTVMSYVSDRERSVAWGILGGLPGLPAGLRLERDGETRLLGAAFAKFPLRPGDRFWRPSSGGGGLGDPLERDPHAVVEDVADGYVTIERARKDYGVVVREVDARRAEYALDSAATDVERRLIRDSRRGWLAEDAEQVAARYRRGELDALDLVRRYGVIVDWESGELLPETTRTFRAMLLRRASAHWTG